MSLGEITLCEHAQSGNILNLESISVIAICSGNVPMLKKKAQLDLNNSVHMSGMLVFKCTVDISSTISWLWKYDSIKWTSLSHEKNSAPGGLDPQLLVQQASARSNYSTTSASLPAKITDFLDHILVMSAWTHIVKRNANTKGSYQVLHSGSLISVIVSR